MLTNIYNEEYLLPFWLDHHKDMFDHVIVLDYNSTDRSMDLVREICPHWEIRTTRNEYFGAREIDAEFMDIERTLPAGTYKIVLNTTEFLLWPADRDAVRRMLVNESGQYLRIPTYSLLSEERDTYPANCRELFAGATRVNTTVRSPRFLHSYEHGNYTVGRHSAVYPETAKIPACILWVGFYPWNERIIARKAQIKTRMPESDKKCGLGFHHLWSDEKMEEERRHMLNNSHPISDFPIIGELLSAAGVAAGAPPSPKKRYIVTGGAGFIGSHLVDALIRAGNEVVVLDNLLSGYERNLNPRAQFKKCDLRNFDEIAACFAGAGAAGVFHLAAIPRTPWCIDDPILAYQTNVMGTLHVLEAARRAGIKRVVMTSSNVVYAFWTPYRSSKEALEDLGRVYTNMYGLSVICLRNSNVYGQRQSEEGPSPNVFAALRKSKKENGYLTITGDGEQSRDFTHVSDIVAAHIAAMEGAPDVVGEFDLCTGHNTTMNEVAKFFDCPVKYVDERPGDIKHIFQDPEPAARELGWRARISLEEGMRDFMADPVWKFHV